MKLRSPRSKFILFYLLLSFFYSAVAQALYSDENSANSEDTAHSSPLSSQAPHVNLPLATAILKRLKAGSSLHQGIAIKMSGEYRLHPDLASPIVANLQLEVYEPDCILVYGDDWLGEKIKLPYVSQDKRTFWNKDQERTWVPGDVTPLDLYKLIWVGAPIPEVFQRVTVSWSEKNPNWFKLTITYTERTRKVEILHVNPSTWRVVEAKLQDLDENRVIWEIKHEGILTIQHNTGLTDRLLPEKTMMKFTFRSASGLERKRAMKFTWESAELLSNRARHNPQACHFLDSSLDLKKEH